MLRTIPVSSAQENDREPLFGPPAPRRDPEIEMLVDILLSQSARPQQRPSQSPPAIGGNPLAQLLGGGASGGFPSFGASGVGSGVGGAPGAAATSGGGSGLAAAAPALGYAYLIGQGKMLENQYPDSPLGRALLSGLGPSIPQMIADPKLAGFAALGVPFLGGVFRNDKAAKAEPEFAGLWRGLGL